LDNLFGPNVLVEEIEENLESPLGGVLKGDQAVEEIRLNYG
jgi:hypothetical protein